MRANPCCAGMMDRLISKLHPYSKVQGKSRRSSLYLCTFRVLIITQAVKSTAQYFTFQTSHNVRDSISPYVFLKKTNSIKSQQLSGIHAFLSVATSVREGQCCLSHIWETEEQRLSTLESMRESRERNQRAPTPPCLCWSHCGTPGNCCMTSVIKTYLQWVALTCFPAVEGTGHSLSSTLHFSKDCTLSNKPAVHTALT